MSAVARFFGMRPILVLSLVLLVLPSATGLTVDVPAGPTSSSSSSSSSAPAGAHVSAAAAAAAEYEIRFRCPEMVDAPTTDGAPLCPAYVLDREDIFGQPVLLVDPQNPALVGFAAMHGGRGVHATPSQEPPTERSRSDAVHQPHTTFRSGDAGLGWDDMPYHAPDSLRQPDASGVPTRDVYGEDNAATLDAQGRIYLASLYAWRSAAAPLGSAEPWQYAVGVWKAKRLDAAIDYNVNTKVLSPSEPMAVVDSPHLVHNRFSDAVVLVWREESANGSRAVVHTTMPQDGALWTRQDAVEIGPCASISNPLSYAEFVFVGCSPSENSTSYQVHAIDTQTWTSRVAGEAPLQGRHVLLVPRGDTGHMVLVSSGLDDAGAPTVEVAYGEMGGAWGSPEQLAQSIAPATAMPILEARVTAAGFAPLSGNVHLVYMERYDLASANKDPQETAEFAKFFVAVKAEGTYQGRADLQVGTVSRLDYSPTLQGLGTGGFNDLHDSIVVWTPPDGGEAREFVAFGDYGYVRFGEVVEVGFTPPAPLIPISTAAVPLATGSTVPLTLGIPAGLLAGAMVARTLAARRKAAMEVGAE